MLFEVKSSMHKMRFRMKAANNNYPSVHIHSTRFYKSDLHTIAHATINPHLTVRI
jgi:hypothetical protein